jgi:pyruvate decarboxylase
MCAVRHDMIPLALQLVEETQLPFITTPMAKASIPEDHPLFRGVYCGKVSNPDVYSWVQSCDLACSVGRMRADMNTGAFSYILDPEIEIELHSTNVTVQFATYDQINFFNLLPRLIEALKPLKFGKADAGVPHAGLSTFNEGSLVKDRALTQEQMWPMIASTFKSGVRFLTARVYL